MSESHFDLVTRKGIESRITEAYEAGDIKLTDEQLDIYPGGKARDIWTGYLLMTEGGDEGTMAA